MWPLLLFGLLVQEPIYHPKLGELHYSARVGAGGVTKGKPFMLDFLGEGDELRSIQVCTRTEKIQLIAAVHFGYGAGKKAVVGSGGVCAESFAVKPGLRLVGVSGAGGWWIDQIRFHFSDGSMTPLYGGKGGDHEFRLSLRQKEGQSLGRLSGFWGTMLDGMLESIGLLYWPAE